MLEINEISDRSHRNQSVSSDINRKSLYIQKQNKRSPLAAH
jgi:hypothetical protein